jgi:hypothetical protein
MSAHIYIDVFLLGVQLSNYLIALFWVILIRLLYEILRDKSEWLPQRGKERTGNISKISTKLYIFATVEGKIVLYFELYAKIVGIYLKFNPLKAKRGLLYLKTQFVPRSKHFSSRL